MKKRKLAAGIAAAALVAVLSISAVYAGNQGKSVSALWGEILKQSADEEKINTQSADDEPLYAVGKDVSITMKEYEQVKSFYKLKSEDDGQAAKDADKEIKQYNALYAAAVKNGYSVTDEQVQGCVKRGICKVNFATELRNAYTRAVERYLLDNPNTIDPKAYSKGGDNVTNPLITEGEEWVVRGGNYTSDAADVRSAARDYTKHDAWLKTDPQQPKSIWWYSDIRGIGFRVVCEPDPAIGAK